MEHLSADELLATTRAVRRRLDLDRPVEPALIRECLELALQAPSATNTQPWHFVVVTDPATRAALGELYRRGGEVLAQRPNPYHQPGRTAEPAAKAARRRVMESAVWLVDHLDRVPVHLIPCIYGRPGPDVVDQASHFGSILPAVWSFMLAARARGLGSSLTTAHLVFEEEAAALLGIPYEQYTQVALVPIGHLAGGSLRRGQRGSLETVLHWDRW
jgi:nitroreductase